MNKTEIVSYDSINDEYLMNIAAPAENNKANIELIKHLQKHTGLKPKIKSGLASKKKHVSLY